MQTEALNTKPRLTFYLKTLKLHDALNMSHAYLLSQTCEDANRRFEHETSLNFLSKLVNIGTDALNMKPR